MNDRTKQIIELFDGVLATTNNIKMTRGKFTRLVNSIERVVIKGELNVLFTDDEIAELDRAREILSNFDERVEQARIIKERDESRIRSKNISHRKDRMSLIEHFIDPILKTPLDVLILKLFVSDEHTRQFIEKDIEGLFHAPDSLTGELRNWRRYICHEIFEQLLNLHDVPVEKKVKMFIAAYEKTFKKETAEKYSEVIRKFNSFLAVKNGKNVDILILQ